MHFIYWTIPFRRLVSFLSCLSVITEPAYYCLKCLIFAMLVLEKYAEQELNQFPHQDKKDLCKNKWIIRRMLSELVRVFTSWRRTEKPSSFPPQHHNLIVLIFLYNCSPGVLLWPQMQTEEAWIQLWSLFSFASFSRYWLLNFRVISSLGPSPSWM